MRGNKKLGRPERNAQQMKIDGGRLLSALKKLGDMSQRDAGRRTGIAQGHLSEMISGKRPVFVRDRLAALSKIGITADYLYGFTDELIPHGQTRDHATLENDLASAAERELEGLYPPSFRAAGKVRNFTWVVSGQKLLAFASQSLAGDAARELANAKVYVQTARRFDSLNEILQQLLERSRREFDDAIEAGQRPTPSVGNAALGDMLRMMESLRDDLEKHRGGQSEFVVLMPKET